jgi:carbonic anhydrase/acetyltransferase-like protein (isoleucine patch superfamily)
MRKWRSGLIVLFMLFVATATAATASADSDGPTFVDPTARLVNAGHIQLGHLVFVAPFATLNVVRGDIAVGDETDIQDNVLVDARTASIHLGDQVILAHGAAVRSGATIGEGGTCPGSAAHCPSFVGFNAEVDGAIVERDAMVSTLARVGPGVRIPSGRRVLPGANVVTQAQVTAKSAAVTQGDREFMHGVIEVNVAFAKGYSQLQAENPDNVRGINVDPGGTSFNPVRNLPTLAGTPTRYPASPARIIGDVRMADNLVQVLRSMRATISLRADEGEPFTVGTITSMGLGTTFHALEHSHIHLGNQGTYGANSLVHGGPAFDATTESGVGLRLGESAVLFQSRVGDNVTIGRRSLVQASDLPDGAVVAPNTVVVGGVVVGTVEW